MVLWALRDASDLYSASAKNKDSLRAWLSKCAHVDGSQATVGPGVHRYCVLRPRTWSQGERQADSQVRGKGGPIESCPIEKSEFRDSAKRVATKKQASTHAKRLLSTIEQAGIFIKRSVRWQDWYPDEG